MGSAERNKAVVADVFAAADAGDLARIEAMLDPDYRDHTLAGSRLGADRQHALAAFREIAAAFPDARHEVLAMVAENDIVVARVSASGTHRGPFRGVPATGRVVTMVTTVMYRVRDGRIVDRWCDGASPVLNQLQGAGEGGGVERPRFLHGVDGWRADVAGARYREVALERVSFTHFELDPATDFPVHTHQSEQITFVLSGQLDFEVGGQRHRIREGEAIAIPSGVPHAVRSGDRRTIAVDAWSPPPNHLSRDPA